jgi:dihydrofolate synthase/folylpolyglutamate synthase
MNYRQCLNYLYGLQKFGIKLGLVSTAKLLNYLGNPHFKFSSIHIAGTNAKGSVCAMLESILCQAGYRTGLYTSPHLVSFSERVRICGKELEPEFVADFVNQLKPRIERDQYTFFEVTTALALLYFAEQRVDVAVAETGLGGRLDSTNLIHPEVVGITNIALEHTEILGKSLQKIAKEKGGIIKSKVPTVLGIGNSVALKHIRRICQYEHSKLISVRQSSNWRVHELSLKGCRFSAEVGGEDYSQLFVNLAGRHQVSNAVMVLNVAELLRKKGCNLPFSAIAKGLRSVSWPARFQVYRRRPRVILDVAHNPSSAEALIQTFADLLPDSRVRFIFGVMSDKDYYQMLETLSPRAENFIFVRPKIDRAEAFSKLREVAKRLDLNYSFAPSVAQAYQESLGNASVDDVICITGSHYTVGEFLQGKLK